MFKTDRLDTSSLIIRNRFFIEGLKTVTLIIAASIFIGLSGRLSIPLPFSPIPLVIQNQMCLFLSIYLGRKTATAAVLLFLIQGALGFPVFALGQGGLPILLGPRGGFLFGYLIATWITGYLYENSRQEDPFRSLISLSIGSLSIYLFGVAHLSSFLGIKSAFLIGIVPFILGDAIKVLIFSKMTLLRFFRIKEFI